MFKFEENKDITSLTTFGIPAKARYFAEYASERELLHLVKTPVYNDNEVLHIGGGSNLLFENDFNGLVIHSAIKGITDYRKDDATVFVIAGAGEKWDDLVAHCVEKGFAGLENLSHIPGEAGASAIQNVGAYGVEAKDYLHAVECYDRELNKVVTLRAEECGLGYRDSIFKHKAKGRYFIMRVSYRLVPDGEPQHLSYGPLKNLEERLGHKPTIAEVREEIINVRKSKLPEPEETGSAGSFFKNPVVSREYYEKVVKKVDPAAPGYELPDDKVKLPAGWLIEHAGLKGKRIGGAEVYPKQCLVIANTGDANAGDVVKLAREVRTTVGWKFHVALEPEVNFINTAIDVTVLGSGTSKGIPEIGCHCEVCESGDAHDKRQRASVLVQTHGLDILIDSSADFRRQALDNDIDHLDAVLITHQHYDHVGGLDDLRPISTGHNVPLYLSERVASDLRKRLDYCFRPHPYPGVPTFDLNIISEREPFFIKGLKIIPIGVNHGKMPILGYRIGAFAYITDAKTIEFEELEKLMGVDTLIINALRKTEHFAHLTLEEALAIIRKVSPRKAYITHLSHEMGLHAEVEKELPENVHLAYDGLHIKIE